MKLYTTYQKLIEESHNKKKDFFIEAILTFSYMDLISKNYLTSEEVQDFQYVLMEIMKNNLYLGFNESETTIYEIW